MIYKINISDWAKARNIFLYNYLYIFRGQSDESWDLTTSLNRSLKFADRTYPSIWEKRVLREFKRGLHNHYDKKMPDQTKNLEWLALMQHYSCPTRLLDFTYSFYIGAYFAIEGASESCALWCLNKNFINKEFTTYEHSKKRGEFNLKLTLDISSEDSEMISPGIGILDPEIRNERLEFQKGLFLYPRSLEGSFEKNLLSALTLHSLFGKYKSKLLKSESISDFGFKDIDIKDINDSILKNSAIFKLVFNFRVQEQALLDLKSMNIGPTNLFPGIDGYARSFKSYRVFQVLFPEPKDE